jgi:hypothetical protein
VRFSNSQLSGIAVLWLTLLSASCSRQSPRYLQPVTKGISGSVLVDVLEAGHPEHYWQYRIQPALGSVREFKQQTFSDYAHEDIPEEYARPAGATDCERQQRALSYDGKFSCVCATGTQGEEELSVRDEKTKSQQFHWIKKGRQIRGFARAPNSEYVTILNVSSYYEKKTTRAACRILRPPCST